MCRSSQRQRRRAGRARRCRRRGRQQRRPRLGCLCPRCQHQLRLHGRGRGAQAQPAAAAPARSGAQRGVACGNQGRAAARCRARHWQQARQRSSGGGRPGAAAGEPVALSRPSAACRHATGGHLCQQGRGRAAGAWAGSVHRSSSEAAAVQQSAPSGRLERGHPTSCRCRSSGPRQARTTAPPPTRAPLATLRRAARAGRTASTCAWTRWASGAQPRACRADVHVGGPALQPCRPLSSAQASPAARRGLC
jgi:hypothetical protein